MKKYDVIVVGAGLAGLMAARELEKNKINYLIIDSKKEIGLPLRCGEGVREKGFLKMFGTKKFNFVKNTITEHVCASNNLRRGIKTRCLELDRPEFEKWLAKPLNNIKLRTECRDVKIKEDCVDVITSKGKLKAELVILAYGANYKIQNKYGLNTGKICFIPAYGGIFRNHKLDKNKFYYYFNSNYFGYLWIFPKSKEEANIGFGSLGVEKNLKKTFYSIANEFGLKELKLVKEYSGIFPRTGPIKKTYTDRLMVCGNAAGQVYAGTGEGIHYALRAGTIAGEITVEACNKKRFDKQFLKNYEKIWKREFGKILKRGTVFGYLAAIGYKYNKYEKLFRDPTEEELRGMILFGKIPGRAMFAYRLIRLLNIIKEDFKDLRKEPIPKKLRVAYKIVKFFYKKH